MARERCHKDGSPRHAGQSTLVKGEQEPETPYIANALLILRHSKDEEITLGWTVDQHSGAIDVSHVMLTVRVCERSTFH